MRRHKCIAIISIVLLSIAVVSALLWVLHRHRLRSDMEMHLTSAIAHIERGEYYQALADTQQSAELAQRLKDEDAERKINTHIRLIKAAIRGDELFIDGDYRAALQEYTFAADYASDINELNAEIGAARLDAGLLDDKIAETEAYIAFYALISSAQSAVEMSDYEAALSLYGEALLAAAALNYDYGINLAETGIEEVNVLILEAKREGAAELFSQGERLYNDRQYAEALEYLYEALELFTELGDDQNTALTNTMIDVSERMLAEMQQIPSPDRPVDIGENQTEPQTNYEHNRRLTFDMLTPIDNQNHSPANQVRMGMTEGMNEGWYNGCGWVAAYNALILLGNPQHPAEIVRYFEESGGTVLGGVFGTYPNTIESYIRGLGYNVTHRLFPQVTLNIDDAIRNSRVSILAYVHTGAAHYITIEYREDIGKFVVYNDSLARAMSADMGFQSAVEVGAAVDSVAAFINNTPNIIISFSLIAIT